MIASRRFLGHRFQPALLFGLTACLMLVSASCTRGGPFSGYRPSRLAKKYNVPLTLYGRVVDGNESPVPNTKVILSVSEFTPGLNRRIPWTQVNHEVVSDQHGLFIFTGEGRKIVIRHVKGDGKWFYDEFADYVRAGRSFTFASRNERIYSPDKKNPVTVVLLKPEQHPSVMPSPGGAFTDHSGVTVRIHPCLPETPSVWFGGNDQWKPGVPRWVRSRFNKSPPIELVAQADRAVLDRISACDALKLVYGELEEVVQRGIRIETRSLGRDVYYRVISEYNVKAGGHDLRLKFVAELTNGALKPARMSIRKSSSYPLEIPLWTPYEIESAIQSFPGTQLQRDVLFKNWRVDSRASQNVITWLFHCQPIVIPYQTDGEAASIDALKSNRLRKHFRPR